jgi:hypothetical protein
MTRRVPCPAAPGLLEGYAARFDDLFGSLAQRRGFREYLAGSREDRRIRGRTPAAGHGQHRRPQLVAEAFGMTRDAVTAYLADRVDPTRLADL